MISCSAQVSPCAVIKMHRLPKGLGRLKRARAGFSTSSTIHLQPLSIIKQWSRYRTSVQLLHAIVHTFHLYGPVNLTCAMVAVLETKAEAMEDSIRAFLVEKKRFAICARACTTKIKVSNFKIR